MQKYLIDGQYKKLLEANGLNADDVLEKAKLPSNTFDSEKILMTSEEYFRFMEKIGLSVSGPEDYIKLSTYEGIETFSPPIFAAYCAENGKSFIERLARYKRLIGPMYYDIQPNKDQLIIKLDSIDGYDISGYFALGELMFIVNLIRKGTNKNISPLFAEITIKNIDKKYLDYIGSDIKSSGINRFGFAIKDLNIPFMTNNEAMWNYFKPELDKRLAEIDIDDSTSAKVRSVLSDLMPIGKCDVEDVANELSMSKRSLQRKLAEENTTFQKQLNSVREVLAKNYLKNTDMSVNDIAYMLGYQELNSFLRAFASWTGCTTSQFKRQRNHI